MTCMMSDVSADDGCLRVVCMPRAKVQVLHMLFGTDTRRMPGDVDSRNQRVRNLGSPIGG
jgi:hypothetical protein